MCRANRSMRRHWALWQKLDLERMEVVEIAKTTDGPVLVRLCSPFLQPQVVVLVAEQFESCTAKISRLFFANLPVTPIFPTFTYRLEHVKTDAVTASHPHESRLRDTLRPQ